jgi:hypothetical protein
MSISDTVKRWCVVGPSTGALLIGGTGLASPAYASDYGYDKDGHSYHHDKHHDDCDKHHDKHHESCD